MGEAVQVAEAVLGRSNDILQRLEVEWKRLLPDQIMTTAADGKIEPSPRLLEFEQNKNAQILQIRQEIDNIRLLTEKDHYITDDQNKQQPDNVPKESPSKVVPNATNRKTHVESSTSEDEGDILTHKRPVTFRKNSTIVRRGKREAMTEELYRKIEDLEKQISEVRSLHKGERSFRRKDVTLDGLEMGYSSSPVKSSKGLRFGGSAEGIPNLELASVPSISPVKSMRPGRVGNDGTFTVRLEGKGSSKGGEYVKKQLVETERIVNEGFRTARDLNDKLDCLRRNKIGKRSRDVALQVSVTDKDNKNKQNDRLLKDAHGKTETHVHSCCRCRPKQENNVKVVEVKCNEKKSPPKTKLSVQKLPSIDIRGSLARQVLPSVHIEACKVDTLENNRNNNVTVVEHGRISPLVLRSDSRDSIESLLREVVTLETCRGRSSDQKFVSVKSDVGLQTNLSRSSGNRNNQLIDEKVDRLARKCEEKLLTRKRNERILGNEFVDLLNKVSESKEKCERFSEGLKAKRRISYDGDNCSKKHATNFKGRTIRELDVLFREDKPEIDKKSGHRLDNEERHIEGGSHRGRNISAILSEDRTKLKSRVALFEQSPAERVSEGSKESKSQISNMEGEDYESDFEVESLQADDLKLSSRSVDEQLIGARSSPSEIKDEEVLNGAAQNKEKVKGEMKEVDKKKNALNVESAKYRKPKEKFPRHSLSPPSPIVIPSDESLIDEQMKRLGLTTQRPTSSRTRGASEKTKNPKNSCLLPVNPVIPEHFDSTAPMRHKEETLYIKSNGQFIPVDPLKGPQVNIIVPEIVVKLPEKSIRTPSPVIRPSSPPNKLDRLVQTDEGCGTLTSVDTTSVVEKINQHFERTQILLDRLDSRTSAGRYSRRKKTSLLDNLHFRGGPMDSSSSSSTVNIQRQPSLGELVLHKSGKQQRRNEELNWNQESEGEMDFNNTRSIGEVLSSDGR